MHPPGGQSGKMVAMVTLRCTRKLRQKLGGRPIQEGAPSTTTLGDWYGNLFFTRHARLIVFVSERSRLAVLLPARDFPALEVRFRAAVVDLLRQLGVSEKAIRREEQAMAEVVYAPTCSRSILGTMNDYYGALRSRLEDQATLTLTQHALRLSDILSGPMDYASPRDVTQFLLSEWRTWTFTPEVQ